MGAAGRPTWVPPHLCCGSRLARSDALCSAFALIPSHPINAPPIPSRPPPPPTPSHPIPSHLQAYARTVVPLLFAPELAGRPGLLFNQGGEAILPSPQLKDPQTVGVILKKSRELVARALAVQLPASQSK